MAEPWDDLEAQPRVMRTLPGGAAIVPKDSIAGRSLTAVVAIMTFLAALTTGFAMLVVSAASDWQSEVSRFRRSNNSFPQCESLSTRSSASVEKLSTQEIRKTPFRPRQLTSEWHDDICGSSLHRCDGIAVLLPVIRARNER